VNSVIDTIEHNMLVQMLVFVGGLSKDVLFTMNKSIETSVVPAAEANLTIFMCLRPFDEKTQLLNVCSPICYTLQCVQIVVHMYKLYM
jgi:hypothetical protein